MQLPDGFVLGTATASYQIEGAVREDGRGPSIWDVFSHTPGKVEQGHTGDVACDHYHRVDDDLDLLAWLGVEAYRFSIAWPRVQPSGSGPANVAGLDFYDRLVDGLLARGIAPMATLYHWDLPQGLEDRDGWRNRDTAGRFADYAAICAKRLGDRVATWATLNEPWCSTILGHWVGRHAPGMSDEAATVRAGHTLLLAHGMGTQALRSEGAQQCGIVLNLTDVRPASDDPADLEAQQRVDAVKNRWWTHPILEASYPDDLLASFDTMLERESWLHDGDLEVIAQPQDWLGLNYYHPETVAAGEPRAAQDGRSAVEPAEGPGLDGIVMADPPGERTTMGWPVDPQGLVNLVQRLADDHDLPPLWITENGMANFDEVDPDAPAEHLRVDDAARIDYLRDHLTAFLSTSSIEGVDLRGYLVWSFMDNFEWARGYAQRFGIVHVDYDTQVRTPKRSAHWLRKLVATRELDA